MVVFQTSFIVDKMATKSQTTILNALYIYKICIVIRSHDSLIPWFEVTARHSYAKIFDPSCDLVMNRQDAIGLNKYDTDE